MTPYELRGIVSDEIEHSIEFHRASRAVSDPNYTAPTGPPTESEIDDFILTNQLFDFETIQNLVDEGLLGLHARTASLRVEDLLDFRKRAADWAETNSWLGADLEYLWPSFEEDSDASKLWVPDSPKHPLWVAESPSALFLAKEMLDQGQLLSSMGWRDFEKLIALLLERSGWTVELLGGTKDGGVDVIAERHDPEVGTIKSIWQAKKNSPSNKVQLSDVRELSAVRDYQKVTKGVLVTTSRLTKGAIDWIRQDQFRLAYKDGPDVEDWIKRVTL